MSSESTENTTVLVTGASGFIASHIIQQLQQAGYQVRGTVRSLNNEEKVKPLRQLCPGAKHELQLVKTDLSSADGWAEAVRGCTYVIHAASPFPMNNPKDEAEVIQPAVEGTLIVLRTCSEVGGVKRVVVTSSVAAVSGGFDFGGSYSEKDWPDVDKLNVTTYTKSKALAEKAAWDYMADMSEENKFELAVINPSFVLGPVLCGGMGTSMEMPKLLLERGMPAIPHCKFPMVDVRDVASAHVIAMTKAEAAGNRHILSSDNLWFKEIAEYYREEFYPLGYNVPTMNAPYFLIKIMSFFDKPAKALLESWGKVTEYDNTRMREVLGVEPRPGKVSLIDMGYSMIEKGFVKKTNKYKELKGEI